MKKYEKRLKNNEKFNTEEWLVTYSDVITLLLSFFVILLAISEVDPIKFRLLNRATGNFFADEDSSNDWEERLRKELNSPDNFGIEVKKTNNGVIFSFQENLSFEQNSADVSDMLRSKIVLTVEKIKLLALDNLYLEISGHTSSDEQDRWNLSSNRMLNIVNLLIETGVSENTLRGVAMSDNMPKVLSGAEHSPNSLNNNQRRVEIRVYKP